ncbi:hypothetical protein HanPSC8_Chr06g0234601 [Helianthus annuus]|nr:hypothetical protein HanPSC8_Chr06g0234601 [Helianthus annuus]
MFFRGDDTIFLLFLTSEFSLFADSAAINKSPLAPGILLHILIASRFAESSASLFRGLLHVAFSTGFDCFGFAANTTSVYPTTISHMYQVQEISVVLTEEIIHQYQRCVLNYL